MGLIHRVSFTTLQTLVWAMPVVQAGEPARLVESFPAGTAYHVSCRVDLKGTLMPEPEKGKAAAKPIEWIGESAIEYDERVLTTGSAGDVEKTIRIYRRIDFQRKIDGHEQKQAIRPCVRRLVLLRHRHTEVPFSPDGPLLWGEIDLVRTDVFTPALLGLLPANLVRVGDRWNASTAAVQELTDMERIEEGQIACKLEEITPRSSNSQSPRQARIAFSGSIRGVNEDGPNRQQLEGFVYFNLESNHLSFMSLKGTHSLLDKQGKEIGKLEGRFVLTRQTQQRGPDLSDEALKGLPLEPNSENTLLLYDNPQLAIRFLYPRRWRIASEHGSQIALDAADGSGLLLTIEPPARVPTPAQFLKESREFLAKQKGKVIREEPVKPMRSDTGQIEHFALDVEVGGQKVFMDYAIIRQKAAGATLAARLVPADLTALRAEVERIARSMVLTGKP